MIKVGLTGGIGSGKSEVARLLAGHGAVVVDADALAREAVAPGTEGLARVVAEFGTEVLDADGALDRSKLAQIVFADADRLAALNAIVHPYVGRRSAEIMTAAPAEAVVVYDVPLLVENNLAEQYDVVVVVDASLETQVDRLTRSGGCPSPRPGPGWARRPAGSSVRRWPMWSSTTTATGVPCRPRPTPSGSVSPATPGSRRGLVDRGCRTPDVPLTRETDH